MNVRDRTYDVLRAYGVTTIFGNPGFTELPFLTAMPEDFTYYLGLHEGAVVSMADGFASASGQTVLVQLHNAPGLGNAMGNLKTAYHNKTPLVIIAGQQRRDMCVYEPGFFNKDARDLPRPYVKWSYEPARAQDIPAAIARAIHIARQEPAGPVFLALPLDDWEQTADEWQAPVRHVTARTAPDPAALAAAAKRIVSARKPAIIAGAAIDRSGAWDQTVKLAERLSADVFGAPAATRAAFPENHELFRGALVFDRVMMREWLAGHDLLIVIGSPIFDYDMGGVGPIAPDNCEIIQFVDDPDEATRAPDGDAIVGNVAFALDALLDHVPDLGRPRPAIPPGFQAPDTNDPINAHAFFALLEDVRPKDGVIVLEASSHGSAAHMRMKITTPGGFYYAGVGGIGNGVPTAVGLQLGDPKRRVICATGDGAMLYTVQALWTAAQHKARVVILVLDNQGYTVLKSSGDYLGVGHDQPGLDVPGIDLVKLGESFGVTGLRVDRYADLKPALEQALAADGPILVSVSMDATVRPLLS